MSFLDKFRFKKKPFKEEKGTIEKKEEKKAAEEKKEAPEKIEMRAEAVARPSALSNIISRPFLSEKSSLLSEQSKFVFEVDRGANKKQIAEALKAIYGIKPLTVRVMKILGKSVHYGRNLGQTKARKKAIASFPAGTKIDVYK